MSLWDSERLGAGMEVWHTAGVSSMTVGFQWPIPSCYNLPEKLGKLNVQGQKGEGHRGERIGSDCQYGPTGHHGNLGFKLLPPLGQEHHQAGCVSQAIS